jgi:hypothetical protein
MKDEDEELSVEGPDFAEQVRGAEEVVRKFLDNQGNFEAVPELFAPSAACDVLAKEITIVHDGRLETRVGRLVMMGVGKQFNLMGPESALSVFKTAGSALLDEVNRQVGSDGLNDFDEFRRFGRPQQVEFYNFETFYQVRDVVFWSALQRCGLIPSGLEHMARHIAEGKIIRNMLFSPAVPARSEEEPAIMEVRCMEVQFPTPVVEWMDKPLFGGMVKETMHIQNLLTLEPTDVSHPYLPLVSEGTVEFGHRRYYLRRFAGVSPKQGLRGPGIPPEGATL